MEHSEVSEKCSDKPGKKKRKRQKNLLKKILQQMEFYFSDSNLHKDRFLKQEMDKHPDGYVLLDTFLKFNKVKQMTSDVKTIATAIKLSHLLELDETDKLVKRINPLLPPVAEDDRTIYVENLPKCADHDWLRKLFKPCGVTLYVSVPRFKKTGDIKGFAFVEFDSPDAAEKACKLIDPHCATSKWIEKSSDDGSHADPQLHAGKKRKATRQREHSNDSDEQSCSKRLRVESPGQRHECSTQEEFGGDVGDDNEVTVMKRKKQQHNFAECSTQEEFGGDVGDDNEVTVMKRKKKIRFKKKKSHKEEVSCMEAESSSHNTQLAVMPKRQWLHLKKQYRDLQQKNMTQLKKCISGMAMSPTATSTTAAATSTTAAATSTTAAATSTTAAATSTTETKQPEQQRIKQEEKPAKKVDKMEFVSGTVVKICAPEVDGFQGFDVKETKKKLRAVADIAYVDIKEGCQQGYMRCKTSDDAQKLLNSKMGSDYNAKLLSDEEEKNYWKKAEEQRNAKLSTSNKKANNRKRPCGKDKIMQKADKMMNRCNKHIIFAD